jgi:hypothetical protein
MKSQGAVGGGVTREEVLGRVGAKKKRIRGQ